MAVEFYYHPGSPPSRAVWMLLEELKSSGKFNYTEKFVNMPEGEHKKEAYLKINMFGELPGLTHGNFNLGQSRAILRYIATEFGPQAQRQELYPACVKTRATIDMYLDADSDCYTRIFGYLNPIGVIFNNESRREDKLDSLKAALQRYDDMLGGKKYMLGDELTIADFSCFASMGILDMMNFKGYSEYKNVEAWRERMIKLPSVQKCFVNAPNIMKDMYLAKLKE